MPKLSILLEASKATHELTDDRVTMTGEAQPLPEALAIEALPAERSERPADFTNASPFPNRQKERDPAAAAILAAAALAILAFLISMLGLFQIHGPL
jgi:hypothetical protein